MAITLGGTALAYSAGLSTTLGSGALSSDPVAGSAIIVVVQTGDTNNAASGITDNASGNTYAAVPGTAFYNNGYRTEIWRALNVATASGFAVTVTWGASMPERRVTVIEVKGAALTSAVDLATGQNQTAPGAAANAVTSGALGTPSTDGQMVIAATAMDGGADTVTVGTGFTGVGTWNSGTNGQYMVEYLIQGTAAAVAGTFTTDGGAGNWATAAVTVKAAAASATLDQEGFRWYEDNGSESTASAAANQDTNITAAAGATKRLRMLINATGDPATKQYKLQYKLSTDGTWSDIA